MMFLNKYIIRPDVPRLVRGNQEMFNRYPMVLLKKDYHAGYRGQAAVRRRLRISLSFTKSVYPSGPVPKSSTLNLKIA